MRLIIFSGAICMTLFGCFLFVVSLVTPEPDFYFAIGALVLLGGASLGSCFWGDDE